MMVGTDLSHWGRLHDAWQDAEASSVVMPGKEPLPAKVMIAIAEHRVRAIRVLRDALTHDPSLRQRIDALTPHPRDPQGRNWDIPILSSGASQRASYEADFRSVVDMLRDQFDLA